MSGEKLPVALTFLYGSTVGTQPPKRQSAPRERRSRRGSGGITLSDVAKVAAVSAITASRALNTPDKVSPDAVKRVQDAIKRTAVPNMLAGGLAKPSPGRYFWKRCKH